MKVQLIDKMETLGTELDCAFHGDAIVCLRDDRPEDGVLTEIKFGLWPESVVGLPAYRFL